MVYIDHEGPRKPMSNGKHHCLVVVDAFSRFIQLYPVKLFDSTHTMDAMNTFMTFLESPKSSFMIEEHPSRAQSFLPSFWNFVYLMLSEQNGQLGPMGK